jgi:hypothetical protein
MYPSFVQFPMAIVPPDCTLAAARGPRVPAAGQTLPDQLITTSKLASSNEVLRRHFQETALSFRIATVARRTKSRDVYTGTFTPSGAAYSAIDPSCKLRASSWQSAGTLSCL